MIRRDPIGVVASIAPSNYPLMMAAWKIAPALAAGNTVVFKPSEHTPLTILALVPALQEILPPGVLNIVYGGGKGSAASWWGTRRCGWCRSPVISSPGKILQAAAKSVKRTHGTGGKAPVIVCDDADLDEVVNGIRTYGYYNAGQTAPPPAASMRRRASIPSWWTRWARRLPACASPASAIRTTRSAR